MSKLLNTIKGKAPKKMGNLTVLDGSLLEDHTPETNEFLEALSGEARGLREDQLVTGHVVDIRGKDVIIDVGYKGPALSTWMNSIILMAPAPSP